MRADAEGGPRAVTQNPGNRLRTITTSPPPSAEVILRVAAPRRPERELAAWAATVTHLHALGLPAPVPEFAAAWLRRRGIRPDWTAAA